MQSTVFGAKMHEQVEERLKFYESGDAPRKNVDVMREAISEISAANQAVASQKKKKKKRKKETNSLHETMEEHADKIPCKEQEIDPLVQETSLDETPCASGKKKKKKKKLESFEESLEATGNNASRGSKIH